MGKINEYLERKAANIINNMDEKTLEKYTIAKGDAALQYLNRPSRLANGDEARRHDLQTDPGGFVYKSEIITTKAYFSSNSSHREIVFTTNTIMDAAIKKICNAVTAVVPIFSIPNEEDLDNPEEHEKAKNGWKERKGQDILRKAIQKSIKHGFILYEPLDKVPDWYTNAPFFIRAWDEIHERKEPQYGMNTQYDIQPSNSVMADYTIDITLNSKKNPLDKDANLAPQKLHSGLFFDPDNTDDHDGRPWFLGCWNNIIDYESIKEARNGYDEQIGNGFIVVGIPSKDYEKVKDEVKGKIKNIRREQGLVVPIDKDTPMAIEFKGSTFQVDFNADLNDIRRDIIANIGFPERWLFGDSEGAMESSGKDRMQVHDEVKIIFSKWKRFIKLVLKYHGFIQDMDEVEIKAPYELQMTEMEKAENDNLKVQTLDMKAKFLTLDEIRDELGLDPIEEDDLFNAMGNEEDPNNPDTDTPPEEGESSTETPETEKKDVKPIPEPQLPFLELDNLIKNTKYDTLESWWGVSRKQIAKIKKTMEQSQQTLLKTDSIMLDSIELGPDLYASSGLIVPAQTKYYEEYKANFIRSPKQLTLAYERQKNDQLPIGVYRSNGHDEGIEVGDFAQFGQARLEKADKEGIFGTIVYDLTKVDEILGKDNWIRKRLAQKKRISTSVGLQSVDVPVDATTKYEFNHLIKSFVATEHPRNESAGVT